MTQAVSTDNVETSLVFSNLQRTGRIMENFLEGDNLRYWTSERRQIRGEYEKQI